MKMFRQYIPRKSICKYVNWTNLLLLCFGALLIIACANFYPIYKHIFNIQSNKLLKTEPFEGDKFVHLDLKGAPPKISYLLEFLDLVKKLGGTGIVIEYEDMFPYSGRLKNISAGNAYTLQDIEAIDSRAKSLNLQVVPLVQTFGHLGFLLKNEEFKHLREYSSNMEVICPSNEESKSVLIEMISQVLKGHPGTKIIHIGGDEVFTLGRCPKCSWRLRKGLSSQTMFLEHLTSIAFKIKQMNPKLKILMWDDHLRKMDPNEIELSNITNYVEPVVWYYGKDVTFHIEPQIFRNYNEKFKNVWIASAFKGASKSNQYAPDVQTYIANHKSWMQTVQYFKGEIKFSGIILTGWQRYDHFSVLCELLPIAIPTLAICMHYIQGIQIFGRSIQASRTLGCSRSYGLLYPQIEVPECSYPGSKLMKAIVDFNIVDLRVSEILKSDLMNYLNDYNLRYRYANPILIEKPMQMLQQNKKYLYAIKIALIENMMPIYDRHTIIEWIETYVDPLLEKMQKVLIAFEDILNEDTKPRRPFTFNINGPSPNKRRKKHLH